jgi:hypothetical protein
MNERIKLSEPEAHNQLPNWRASSARITLPEPVQVDSFWRNRRHEAVVSKILTHEGRNIFDLRAHAMQNGKLVPTKKGVAVVVLRLPDLHKAITKALKRARDLGLLPPDGGGASA